ncbi:MAG: hypothetical protein ACJ0DG_08605 [bacterium]
MKYLKFIIPVVLLIFYSHSSMAYKESPMLKKLVKSGKLPPVDQRLPENPLVESPVSETGKYGGKLVLGTAFFLDDERLPSRVDRNGFFSIYISFPF